MSTSVASCRACPWQTRCSGCSPCGKRATTLAYDLFAGLLPFINFTLQDFELFLQVEKRLLVRRGLFSTLHLRSLTYTLSPELDNHAEFLIEQVLRIVGPAAGGSR